MRTILSASGVNPEETPYRGFLDVSFDAGDFFAVETIDAYRPRFKVFAKYEKELAARNSELLERLAELTKATGRAKNFTQPGDAAARDRLRALREERKAAAEAMDGRARDFYASKPEKHVVTYKNALIADTFANIAGLIPGLDAVRRGRLRETPLFTRGIEELNGAALENLGVEGGPCLFGNDEMLVEVTHKNGDKYSFDFNSGANRADGPGLTEHFTVFGERIRDVSFDNRKDGVTLQEYESLAIPMEIADVLDASFVFPIPDASYKKYIASISTGMDPSVRSKMLEAFTVEAHRIADLYLALFDRLRKLYTPRRSLVLHERDDVSLRLFYEKREKYLRRQPLKYFSTKTGKEESVKDYITFVAAPYYFWGTRNLLQVDSIDEADCARKCAKIHGKEIASRSILFPEMLSENGVDTMFNAKREHKIYV